MEAAPTFASERFGLALNSSASALLSESPNSN